MTRNHSILSPARIWRVEKNSTIVSIMSTAYVFVWCCIAAVAHITPA